MRQSVTPRANGSEMTMAAVSAKFIVTPWKASGLDYAISSALFVAFIRCMYLNAYVAMFEWAHNVKRVTVEYLRALMVPNFT